MEQTHHAEFRRVDWRVLSHPETERSPEAVGLRQPRARRQVSGVHQSRARIHFLARHRGRDRWDGSTAGRGRSFLYAHADRVFRQRLRRPAGFDELFAAVRRHRYSRSGGSDTLKYERNRSQHNREAAVRSMIMKSLLSVMAVAIAIALYTPALHAHASLERANPPVGSVVSHAPSEVRLWFSENLEPRFSHAEVTTAAGAKI